MFSDDSQAWYFAYGSNLFIRQMLERVGPSCNEVPQQLVHLPNYRLAFNMRGEGNIVYANIETPGPGVLGVIYRCNAAAFVPLDEFEEGYDRVPVEVFDLQQQPITAFVYIAKPECINQHGRATDEYLQRILTGGREQGLPEEYIRQIEAIARPNAG